MKKLLITLVLLAGVAFTPKGVLAEDQVCTTTYGGGVVCGASYPEHETVQAGIEDYPAVLAALGIFVSGGLYVASKKLSQVKESGVIYQSK